MSICIEQNETNETDNPSTKLVYQKPLATNILEVYDIEGGVQFMPEANSGILES